MPVNSLLLHLLVLSHYFLTSDAQSRERHPRCDVDLLHFALNLEYLQAEFLLFGALGHGLDIVAPELTGDGKTPIGAEKANLQWFVKDVIIQLAYQQIGHIRAIRRLVGRSERPLMDLSRTQFAHVVENAIGFPLQPPFDPYLNDVNFLLTAYLFPYISLTNYVGTNSLLNDTSTRTLVGGLTAVEAAQDAIIRTLLYHRALQPLSPYNYNVAEVTQRLSRYRDRLGHVKHRKEDGVICSDQDRNGGMTLGNIVHADKDSVAHPRTPWEVLRIVYGTGTARRAGGFFPVGAQGTIARFYLNNTRENASICRIPSESRERSSHRERRERPRHRERLRHRERPPHRGSPSPEPPNDDLHLNHSRSTQLRV